MPSFGISMFGYKEACSRLDPRKVQKAAKSALTRTKDSAVPFAAKQVSNKYNITQKDLLNKASGNPRIQASGSVRDDMTATISFWAGGVSLVYFWAVEYRQTSAGMTKIGRKGQQSVKRGKVGVKVQIEKGKTTRLRQFFAGVKFGKGGTAGTHLGIFRRAGKDRYPIIQSLVISPATLINRPAILQPLINHVQETFTTRFNHELNRLGVTK